MKKFFGITFCFFLITCGTENEPTYTLTISVSPINGGTIDPQSGEYSNGEIVQLTAKPAQGYAFTGWGGDIDIKNVTTSVTMDSDKSISANFLFVNLQDGEVYSLETGRIWMDRNLGANKVAESVNDEDAQGFLYQWGRGTDGHEVKTSSLLAQTSTSDQPGHSSFILVSAEADTIDWRTPPNNNLWQGVDGINNPCPDGFRIPVIEEWTAEMDGWRTNDQNGALTSTLKLPTIGFRAYGIEGGGGFDASSDFGFYWSSTVEETFARAFVIAFQNETTTIPRPVGASVRCIKHQ